MSYLRLGSAFLSLCFAFVLVKYFIFSKFILQNAADLPYVHWLIILFFALNILGCLGLLFAQKWGVYVGYIAVTFSTVYFSINYVPLMKLITPRDIHMQLPFFTNPFFLLLLGSLHAAMSLKKKD